VNASGVIVGTAFNPPHLLIAHTGKDHHVEPVTCIARGLPDHYNSNGNTTSVALPKGEPFDFRRRKPHGEPIFQPPPKGVLKERCEHKDLTPALMGDPFSAGAVSHYKPTFMQRYLDPNGQTGPRTKLEDLGV
jgi:hypothetical protein